MYSRVRASGLANGWPYQPSTTCGPDTPRPRISRPPREMVERHRRHRGRGRRAGRDLDDRRAELDPLGRAPHQASGISASEPYASAVHTESKPSRSASEHRSRRRPAAARRPSSRCSARVADRAPSRRTLLLGRRACASRDPCERRRLGAAAFAATRHESAACRPSEPRARTRCARGAAARVTLGHDQHVLAERRQVAAAERTAVGRRLAVLRAAHGPPARVLRLGHRSKDVTGRPGTVSSPPWSTATSESWSRPRATGSRACCASARTATAAG